VRRREPTVLDTAGRDPPNKPANAADLLASDHVQDADLGLNSMDELAQAAASSSDEIARLNSTAPQPQRLDP
jgi:hypothetical protein